MNNVNMIASYLFLVWNRDEDQNREFSNSEIFYYRSHARKLLAAVDDLRNELPPLKDSPEEDIQWLMYEIGKRHYGYDKSDLNFWFKNIYTIMFGREQGPRIGTFIHLLGVENFLSTLESRINNPYGFAT